MQVVLPSWDVLHSELPIIQHIANHNFPQKSMAMRQQHLLTIAAIATMYLLYVALLCRLHQGTEAIFVHTINATIFEITANHKECAMFNVHTWLTKY